MGRFLLGRLAYLIVLVVIATAATYFLAAAALNPRSNFEGRNPPFPPEVVDARLDELNLNDKTPIVERFNRWVSGVFRSDLGLTVDGGSVNDEMGRRVGVSLRLLLIGSILGTLAGVATGAYSAVKQYTFSDHAITFVSFVILSINTVVLAVSCKRRYLLQQRCRLSSRLQHRRIRTGTSGMDFGRDSGPRAAPDPAVAGSHPSGFRVLQPLPAQLDARRPGQ